MPPDLGKETRDAPSNAEEKSREAPLDPEGDIKGTIGSRGNTGGAIGSRGRDTGGAAGYQGGDTGSAVGCRGGEKGQSKDRKYEIQEAPPDAE